MFKHLKRKRRHPVVIAGVFEMQSDNINFGLLSYVPGICIQTEYRQMSAQTLIIWQYI
jgi:hypothetical protein